MQHIATSLGATPCARLATLLRHVGCCWLKFDHFQTWANIQHVATHRNTVAKRTQHFAPNDVAICCVDMLLSFGRGFRLYIFFLNHRESSVCPQTTTEPRRVFFRRRAKQLPLAINENVLGHVAWSRQINSQRTWAHFFARSVVQSDAELSFPPAPCKGWTWACERRVQAGAHYPCACSERTNKKR